MASTPQNSASTHRSAVVRGTHEFQIVGYSARRKFGRVTGTSSIKHAGIPFHYGGDNFILNQAVLDAAVHAAYISSVTTAPIIKSGAFQVGGYTWGLVCTFQDKGHLKSITLELLSTNIVVDVVAMASLRINDPLGMGPPAVWRSDAANTFSNKVQGRRWNLSLPDAFRGNEQRYVSPHDDRLTILCTVEVFKEDAAAAAEPTKCFISAVPPPTIPGDFRKLLLFLEKDPGTSDVTFVVQGNEILAHRIVLGMRSPVFAAELLGHMRESTTPRVTIHDMSASTFRAMLHFIYSDELPVEPTNVGKSRRRRSLKEKHIARPHCESMVGNLLVAADRYDLERLRLMCENILVENINVTTIMPTLLLARGQQSCRRLEDSCIEYIASDPDVYSAVRATEEYRELKETCSSFIIEVSERLATHNVGRHASSSSSSSGRRRPPEKSMSMFNSTEVVRGTHEFRISNFSSIQRNHGIDQVITSNIFKVGGYDWMLNVFPSGYSTEGYEKPGEYISVYLRLVTDPGSAIVKSSKRFRIDDPCGKSSSTVRGSEDIFTKMRKSWGFQKFITVESAKSRYMGHDGSLTIHCDIDVTKEAYTTTITVVPAMIAVPPSNIASHLEQLMVSGQGSDVTFLFEESVIHAHWLIIAVRSPLLLEAMMPSMTGVVRIKDMKAAVLKAVLHFIYTDELPCVNDTVLAGEMLAAACRLRLERMKAMCDNLLAQLVTKDNALSMLELAWRHNCKELKLYCAEYISLAMK